MLWNLPPHLSHACCCVHRCGEYCCGCDIKKETTTFNGAGSTNCVCVIVGSDGLTNSQLTEHNDCLVAINNGVVKNLTAMAGNDLVCAGGGDDSLVHGAQRTSILPYHSLLTTCYLLPHPTLPMRRLQLPLPLDPPTQLATTTITFSTSSSSPRTTPLLLATHESPITTHYL